MTATPKASFLRFLPAIGRWVLGLPLIVFGALGLFHPMAPPPDLAPQAKAFSMALAQTGYMMPMIGVVLLVGGFLLVINRFVPLALLLLAPFFVNSVLFHVVLEHTGIAPAAVFSALLLSLAWAYRGVFAGVLQAKNVPGPR
jgi:hypothetical protein